MGRFFVIDMFISSIPSYSYLYSFILIMTTTIMYHVLSYDDYYMFFYCLTKQEKVCSESYYEEYVGFYSHNQVPNMGFDACEVGFIVTIRSLIWVLMHVK